MSGVGEEDRSRMTDDGGLLRSLKDSSLRYSRSLLASFVYRFVTHFPHLITHSA